MTNCENCVCNRFSYTHIYTVISIITLLLARPWRRGHFRIAISAWAMSHWRFNGPHMRTLDWIGYSGTKKAHKGNLHKGIFQKMKFKNLKFSKILYISFPRKTHREGINIKDLKLQKLTKNWILKTQNFQKFRKLLYVSVLFRTPRYVQLVLALP